MASTIQPGGGAGTNSGSVSSASAPNKAVISNNDNTVSAEPTSRVPSYPCFQHATKLAIIEDKPIILDYWTSSLEKTCLIGVRQNNEKLLVKSEDEYTSPIAKIYKVDSEYIIVTENSIYLVSSDISTRRIN
jgi:hypothetical protein